MNRPGAEERPVWAVQTGHTVEREATMEDHPNIRIIAVPYDSGHPGLRMGAGPEHLLENGFGEGLRSGGRGLSVTTVRHEREPVAEVATAFELDGLVSGQVRRALVVGRCWKTMARDVPGFSAVPEENVVMAGGRKVDGAEQERLDASEIAVVGSHLIEKQWLRALAAALDDLKTRVSRVYVHLDLDVLDARKVGKANEFAAEGGPDAEELQAALGMVRERFEVASAGIASYDPAFDANGKVLRAAIASARALTYPASRSG